MKGSAGLGKFDLVWRGCRMLAQKALPTDVELYVLLKLHYLYLPATHLRSAEAVAMLS